MAMDPVTLTAVESLAHELLPALQRRLSALLAMPAGERRCDEATRQLTVNTIELFAMLREWIGNPASGTGHGSGAAADGQLTVVTAVSIPRELVDALSEHVDLLESDQICLNGLGRDFSKPGLPTSAAAQVAEISSRLSQDVASIKKITCVMQQRPSTDLARALQRVVDGNVADSQAGYSMRLSFESFNVDQAQVEVAASAFASAVRCVADGAMAQGNPQPVVEVAARISAGLVRATLRCPGLKSLEGVKLDALARTFAAVKGAVYVLRGERPGVVCEVPASLRSMTGIIVRAGGENYALPVHGIIETLRIDPALIQIIAGQEFLNLRSTSLPLIALAAVVGKSSQGHVQGQGKEVAGPRYAVVVASGSNRFGLVVDGLIQHRDLSLRPLGGGLANRPEVIGGALDSDGKVIMVIDPRHIRANLARPGAA